MAVLLAVLAVLALAAPSPAAADNAKVSYKPPVDSPIVDPYRPPAHPWDAGNRGIDYAPGVGTPVKAAADGEVVFAGPVAGTLAVTILHADGIRTSYSFLQSIAVQRGDHVRQGQVIGTSGEDLNFGARVGDDYIDPTSLFDDGPPVVYLVPDDVRRPGTAAQERSALARFLGGVTSAARAVAAPVGRAASSAAGAVQAGAGIVADQVSALAHEAAAVDPVTHAVRLIQTTVAWWQQRNDCTPAAVPPPPVPANRVAVLVGGIGSSSDHDIGTPTNRDSLDAVNAPGLGYADTVRFSYNGGDASQHPYGPHDTTVDLRTEARRLRDLLEQVHAEHPDAVVDLIAHSQGGIIARTALADEYDHADPLWPTVANLVTLASPYQGSPAGSALTLLDHTPAGSLVEHAADASGVASFNPTGASVKQLAEGSDFLTDLDHRPLPGGVHFTSIGSRGDILVPGVRTQARGARNVIVSLPGLLSDHSQLPGSPQGRREVALAAAGMPPTCQSLTDMLADTVVSDAIATGEDLAGDEAFAVAAGFPGTAP